MSSKLSLLDNAPNGVVECIIQKIIESIAFVVCKINIFLEKLSIKESGEKIKQKSQLCLAKKNCPPSSYFLQIEILAILSIYLYWANLMLYRNLSISRSLDGMLKIFFLVGITKMIWFLTETFQFLFRLSLQNGPIFRN